MTCEAVLERRAKCGKKALWKAVVDRMEIHYCGRHGAGRLREYLEGAKWEKVK